MVFVIWASTLGNRGLGFGGFRVRMGLSQQMPLVAAASAFISVNSALLLNPKIRPHEQKYLPSF